MSCLIVKYLQNVVKMMAVTLSSVTPSDRGAGLCTSVYIWLALLAVCQCLSGTPTAASTTRHWSLAELSVTSSELPKQIPAPPYPVQQQRIQSTPHYDQQLKLPSENGVGSRHHYYPWSRPTVSIIWANRDRYCLPLPTIVIIVIASSKISSPLYYTHCTSMLAIYNARTGTEPKRDGSFQFYMYILRRLPNIIRIQYSWLCIHLPRSQLGSKPIRFFRLKVIRTFSTYIYISCQFYK